MNKFISIAIDGPSGVGKSTVAKCLAEKLNLEYVDTGSMYRAIALKAREENVDMDNSIELQLLLERTNINFVGGNILLDGQSVEHLIRNEEISKLSSRISAKEAVRTYLVELQQLMAKSKSVVMEGRDIGTVVIPCATYKIFLTASSKARADRRYKQLVEMGQDVNITDIKNDIDKRDFNDSTRDISPLKPAEDSYYLDNSDMNLEESVDAIIKYINEGSNGI